jgi:hypothetical protein
MEPIFGDDRSDRWDLGDLLDQRLGIITAEIMATASAVVWLALGDPIDPLGRDQGSAVPRVARLAATVTAGG